MISRFNPINLIEVSMEKPNIGESQSTQHAAAARLRGEQKNSRIMCCCSSNNLFFEYSFNHNYLSQLSSEIVSNHWSKRLS